MKAAVFAGPGRVETRDLPRPQVASPGDVLVRIRACGVCGSDVRALSVPPVMACDEGVVLGHELAGEVVEAGPESGYEVGARVVAIPNVHCRRFAYCLAGQVNLCERFRHLGATRDGAAAEYCLIPGDLLHRVPDELDWEVAALAEPLACVLNGARRAGWRPGVSAVVLGGGPIGLMFLLVAKAAGVTPLVLSEPAPGRAELGRRLGADATIDPTREDVAERVRELTGGLGADVVVDAVGSLLPSALASLRKGGMALVFGLDTSARATIDPSDLVSRELRVEGVYITRGTFPEALATLARDPETWRSLVTHRFGVEQFAEGADAMRAGEAVKAMVFP